MTGPTAVQAQAVVRDVRGRPHVYRTYGRSEFVARLAMYKAAKVYRMKVDKHSFTYRHETIDGQLAGSR